MGWGAETGPPPDPARLRRGPSESEEIRLETIPIGPRDAVLTRADVPGFRRPSLRRAGPLRTGLPQCAGRRFPHGNRRLGDRLRGGFPRGRGSPRFPLSLDAAMHAACAWGQRYRNRVVFPIGFDRREILAPTRAGETYLCRITPLPDEGAVLRFDVRLHDLRPATGRDDPGAHDAGHLRGEADPARLGEGGV